MPEKTKERKTEKGNMQISKGGAEIFIPKKKINKKIKYPKNYDPTKPADPERWLPKWQRSRFKKMAKRKGIYIKGAQGDATVDTDVTQGHLNKSTAHQDASVAKEAAGKNKNKRRK